MEFLTQPATIPAYLVILGMILLIQFVARIAQLKERASQWEMRCKDWSKHAEEWHKLWEEAEDRLDDYLLPVPDWIDIHDSEEGEPKV